MCGIAGYISKQHFEGKLAAMTDSLEHRGPDGRGEWSSSYQNWSVNLGHRRLSIIDIAGGAQPMRSQTSDDFIVYNGELFNFPDIKIDLQRRGVQFSTTSDTEVLLNKLILDGPKAIVELNGMFAFALWDNNKGTLLLARDRAGVKPLYYSMLKDGGIAFSSELSSLLEHPLVSRNLSREGLLSYFFSDYVHPPGTMVQGVAKLEPGEYFIWRNGEILEKKRYWSVLDDQEKVKEKLDEKFVVRDLSLRLTKAVQRQLLSDVPLGVFLSGGLDSSLIAAIAQKLNGNPIKTFSIGFEEASYDESPFARQVAKIIGSDHTEEILSEENVLDAFEDAVGNLDEPLADPSLLPTYLLSQLAVKDVKVALGGDGGDELWAGYPTYLAYKYSGVYRSIPKVFRKTMMEPVIRRLPVQEKYQALEWKLKRFSLRWDEEFLNCHLRWMSSTNTPQIEQVYHFAKGNMPKTLSCFQSEMFNRFNGDYVNYLLALDFMTYLPGSVLTKVDRASMANSLEVRPPFLDSELINWAFSLPSNYKLKGNKSKYLLKESALDFLPSNIIHRKKKGFGIPLNRWVKGPFKARLNTAINESTLMSSGLLNREQVQKWFDLHIEGKEDHSKFLWALLVLDRWFIEKQISIA